VSSKLLHTAVEANKTAVRYFSSPKRCVELFVAALAVEVIRLVVEDEGGQVFMAAAHCFAVLEQEERFVGGRPPVFLFEGRGDDAVDDGDSQKSETVCAQLESQLGVSVVFVDRQLMRIDYAIHMIWYLIVSNISLVKPDTGQISTQKIPLREHCYEGKLNAGKRPTAGAARS
jgi:hypothetical protein